MNSTVFYGNGTQGSRPIDVLRKGVLIFIFLCFCVFLYFVAILVISIFTTAHIREHARYMLFANMLINDILYLLMGILFLATNIYSFTMPGLACLAVYTLASCTTRVTPYNLAVMSLERYVAVCFPLRHAEWCTARRTNLAILIVWILGLIPPVADSLAMGPSFPRFYSTSLVCSKEIVLLTVLQSILRYITDSFGFALVGVIILYTYIKVIIVARQISSGKSSALKAGKTIGVHLFQLLLCMISLMSPYFPNIDFLPLSKFSLFTCLPRFLSPLIYGIRDEILCKSLMKFFSTKL
ncbi:odorant receptor 131-2-like [Pelodytes ibericus]